jgi:WD40 repeat protein
VPLTALHIPVPSYFADRRICTSVHAWRFAFRRINIYSNTMNISIMSRTVLRTTSNKFLLKSPAEIPITCFQQIPSHEYPLIPFTSPCYSTVSFNTYGLSMATPGQSTACSLQKTVASLRLQVCDNYIAFIKVAALIDSVGDDGCIMIWCNQTGKFSQLIRTKQGAVIDLCWIPPNGNTPDTTSLCAVEQMAVSSCGHLTKEFVL